jgi:hypothetical protein
MRHWLVAAAALIGCSGAATPQQPLPDAAPVDATIGQSIDLASNPASDLATVAPTWSNFAQGFFATYCVQCHGPGNTKRDYSQYSQVSRDAATIACGVNPGPDPLQNCAAFPPPRQFPIGTGPFPSDDDRRRILDWIAAGLPM